MEILIRTFRVNQRLANKMGFPRLENLDVVNMWVNNAPEGSKRMLKGTRLPLPGHLIPSALLSLAKIMHTGNLALF